MSLFSNNDFNNFTKDLFSSLNFRGAMENYPKSVLENPTMRSYVRLLHASPKSPDVDVYINDKKIVSDLEFDDFTEYVPITGGIKYQVKICPAGETTPIFETYLEIPPKQIYTLAAVGKFPNGLQVMAIHDPVFETELGNAYVRFCHLSPNVGSVDVVLPDKTVVFDDVSYGEYTDYIQVDPKTYTFNVNLAGTSTNILYVPNITLKNDRIYTIYFVGLLQDFPGLKALVPLDGNSYIELP